MVETLVATTVLLLAIVGVVGVMLTSKNVNDMARYQVIAKEIAQAEIERVKLIGYDGVIEENRETIGYVSFDQLGKGYRFPGISPTTGLPYNWVGFRGIDVTRAIMGQTRNYCYTLKLECEEDFGEMQMARRLRMRAYWLFNGRLKNIEIIFVVGRR